MAKKKKAPQLEAWCWYCDREFEDDKVLLQHQKAKHYKCSYCPRRLNTAGGLTVHLHQVHKAEPTKIENALPGRESFDIEIYGMVGVPEADLAEWRSRRANNSGGMGGGPSGQPGAKRQKVENVVLTPEQLKAQLEAHKALMSGQAPPPGSVPPQFSMTHVPPPSTPQGFSPHHPPPGFPPPPSGFPSGPPPGFGSSYGAPPPNVPRPWGPGQYGGPPPNITTPQPSPHQVAVRRGDKSRIVYTDQTMSPEEKLATSNMYAYIDPDDPPQIQKDEQRFNQPAAHTWPGQLQQSGVPPPAYYGPPPGWQAGSPPTTTHTGYSTPPNFRETASPYTAPHQHPASPYPSIRPPQTGSFSTPPPNGSFSGPPPAPYSGPPPPNFASSPPPPFPPQIQQTPSAPAPPLTGVVAPPSAHLLSPPPPHTQAQSYSAVPPKTSPSADNAEANSSKNLAAVNNKASVQHTAPREADARATERKAEDERREDEKEGDVVPQTEDGAGVASRPASRRARAADLF